MAQRGVECIPLPAQEEPAEACPSAEVSGSPGNPRRAGYLGGGVVMKDNPGGCGPELWGLALAVVGEGLSWRREVLLDCHYQGNPHFWSTY